MDQIVTAAAVGIRSQPGQIAENLTAIAQGAKRAAAAGAGLVLFPELSLSGFIPNHPVGDHSQWLRAALRGAWQIAQPIDSPAVHELCRIARTENMLLCAGMLEDAGNLLFNTQLLVGSEGVLGTWRKMHIPMFEMPFYQPGEPGKVVDAPCGRIGVNICFDGFIPESTRLLSIDNAELVLFPFAADPPPGTAAAWHQWGAPALRCRCAENGVFGLACNYQGSVEFAGAQQHFPGGAMAIDPRGREIEPLSISDTANSVFVFQFRDEDLRAARAEPEYLYRFRRPEIYGRLAQ